ncbi:MAG: acyl-ACP--UDP-N-acetylglucosamine O-acyltransferase [Candidatus Hydrogenedentes bacterium]|nr:acyl-ACP--UDP-N-acetylglucosamine O-acyltransferase [Candidatus Hydrogenedentota bacterium]
MNNIHPTAIVAPDVELGQDVVIGPYCVVESGAAIGDRTMLDSHVVVHTNTSIGSDNHIHTGAVLGGISQTVVKYDGTSWLRIGNGNVIRECVTINRGFSEETGHTTTVGNNGYYMAYCHVGHDCVVGDHVIMANSAGLAGHVIVEDRASIGGITGVHQFCKVGTLSFVGGMSRIVQDAPPYMWVAGCPAICAGLNTEGLRRNGIDKSARNALKKAYKILFRSGLNVAESVARVRQEVDDTPEVDHLVRFIETSKRGVTRSKPRR